MKSRPVFVDCGERDIFEVTTHIDKSWRNENGQTLPTVANLQFFTSVLNLHNLDAEEMVFTCNKLDIKPDVPTRGVLLFKNNVLDFHLLY